MFCACVLPGSVEDHLRYYEILRHDSLQHRITKRDVGEGLHGRILEYASHNRSVWQLPL